MSFQDALYSNISRVKFTKIFWLSV